MMAQNARPRADSMWKYAVNGLTQGPVHFDRLQELAEHGSLKPDSLVREEGCSEWTPASQVLGLLGSECARSDTREGDLVADGPQTKAENSSEIIEVLSQGGLAANKMGDDTEEIIELACHEAVSRTSEHGWTPGEVAADRDPRSGPEAEPPAEIPGFRLVRVIGRGGMGVVWEAVQLSLGRRVALKLMTRELSQNAEFVARFSRESSALARLSHPNIVSVIDRGEAEGTYYFAMEYVERKGGGPPTDLGALMHAGLLNSAFTLCIIKQVCGALAHAHAQGIIHRDIKPSNVLIDGHGNARVVDFGIAGLRLAPSEESARLTVAGAEVGTPAYMAPEQRTRTGKVDERADIYSAGAMLYEMLTGQLTWGSFEPPSELIPGIDPRWDKIVETATQTNSEKRFGSMEEMLQELAGIREVGASGDGDTLRMERTTPVSVQTRVTERCPECGQAAHPDQDYCTKCGRSLTETCPRCNEQLPAWENYCGKCGADLVRVRKAAYYIAEAKKELVRLDDKATTPVRKFQCCEIAYIDLGRALKAEPGNEEASRLLAEVEQRRLPLAHSAADHAMANRQYGTALQVCNIILEEDPGDTGAAARKKEIEGLRQRVVEKAQAFCDQALPKRCRQVFSEAARVLSDDPEFQAARRETEERLERLERTVGETIPELIRSRRYAELGKVLDGLCQGRTHIRGLTKTCENVHKCLTAAENLMRQARDALAVGKYDRAQALAARALELVADLSEASAVIKDAQSRLHEDQNILSRARSAMSSGRCFTAKSILCEFVQSKPDGQVLSPSILEAAQQVEREVGRQTRRLQWVSALVIGGALLSVTRVVAFLLSKALSEATQPVLPVFASRAQFFVACEYSLQSLGVCAVVFAALAVGKKKAVWGILWLAALSLLGGAVTILAGQAVSNAFLTKLTGFAVQVDTMLPDHVVPATVGFGCQGLVLGALAYVLFRKLSTSVIFLWFLYAFVTTLVISSLASWVPGTTAGTQIAWGCGAVCLGIAVAAAMRAVGFAREAYWYLLIPAVSVICYGVVRGTELVQSGSLAGPATVCMACAFGLVVQSCMAGDQGMARRLVGVVVTAVVWLGASRLEMFGLGGELLLCGLVWSVWACLAARSFGAKPEKGLHIRDFLQQAWSQGMKGMGHG